VLKHILAAIAGVQRKMEEKVAALVARKMEGMTPIVARTAILLAGAEEREKRLAGWGVVGAVCGHARRLLDVQLDEAEK